MSSGQLHRCFELVHPNGPLVAPHLEIDVDYVVVGNADARHEVFDLECSKLVIGAVVPDHPHEIAMRFDSVGTGR